MHRGIASRDFERRFGLADFVEVKDATFEDGLLQIDLARELPEAMKPKRDRDSLGQSRSRQQVQDDRAHAGRIVAPLEIGGPIVGVAWVIHPLLKPPSLARKEDLMKHKTDRAPLEAGYSDDGFDLDCFLHPAQAFEHPSNVVHDPDLTLNEKRAILASWASDACAIEAAPALRYAPGGKKPVRFDDVHGGPSHAR